MGRPVTMGDAESLFIGTGLAVQRVDTGADDVVGVSIIFDVDAIGWA